MDVPAPVLHPRARWQQGEGMVPDTTVPFSEKQEFPKTQTGFCSCLIGQDIVKGHLQLLKTKKVVLVLQLPEWRLVREGLERVWVSLPITKGMLVDSNCLSLKEIFCSTEGIWGIRDI